MVRRYADDVNFYVSKQLKDRLRIVQRMVRDHYGDVAEELSRSLRDSVTNAQKAAQASAADREKRLAEVRRALAELDELRHRSGSSSLSTGRAVHPGPSNRRAVTSSARAPGPAPRPRPAPQGAPAPAPPSRPDPMRPSGPRRRPTRHRGC